MPNKEITSSLCTLTCLSHSEWLVYNTALPFHIHATSAVHRQNQSSHTGTQETLWLDPGMYKTPNTENMRQIWHYSAATQNHKLGYYQG